MKGRKLVVDFIIIAFALLLFTKWYENSIESSSLDTSMLNHYKVYLITVDKKTQFWEYINEGAADMAAAMGVNYIWDAPKERNVYKQIEVINNAIDHGANALLIAADDPKMISSVVEDAKAKSIKVIYVDSPAYEEAITSLASNNNEAGVLAGETMLSVLDNMGKTSGSIGAISEAGRLNLMLRDKGFRSVIDKDGRFKLLETKNVKSNFEAAEQKSERLINENKDLVGLYATGSRTTQGMGNAIKEDDNRIVGVGFDITDKNLQLFHDGSLKALVVQHPYTMGYLGMAQAVAAILGKDTGPTYLNTGVYVMQNN